MIGEIVRLTLLWFSFAMIGGVAWWPVIERCVRGF